MSAAGERQALLDHLFDAHGIWLPSPQLQRTSTQALKELDPCASSLGESTDD